MDELRFEWDPVKARINEEKHGVTFEEAKTVFFDADAILFDDPDHSDEEERFLLLGISAAARTVIVCHCYRCENDTVRLISARKATKSEQRQYDEINRGW